MPLAVALVLAVAGPLLVVSLVTGTAASLAASRSAVSVVSPVGRPSLAASRSAVGRQWLARRWSLVVVGRPVGQPCRVRHKYVRNGGGPAPRKRAAVAGGGVPLYPNTLPRCLIAKFFIFFIFYFFENRETSPTSLRERLAKTKPMI